VEREASDAGLSGLQNRISGTGHFWPFKTAMPAAVFGAEHQKIDASRDL
jgi:poly(3-hydroxybutyrate) depolymerase